MPNQNLKTCSVLLLLLFLANSVLSYESEFGSHSLESSPYAGDVNFSSPSHDSDASVLSKTEEENRSQENASVSPSLSPEQDSPVPETEKSIDLFQENTSPPPSPAYIGSPAPETADGGSFSEENSAFSENLNSPASSPLESISDGESFSDQEKNHSDSPITNSPAPEAKTEDSEISPENSFSSAPTPFNSETTQNPETDNPLDLNDNISIPKSAAPAPEVSFSVPETEAEPASENLAPKSHHEVLPFNYRAEDEPVEPYQVEHESWDGMNRGVAGVVMGVCVVGVGGWMYKKRKTDVRAQYQSLAKRERV